MKQKRLVKNQRKVNHGVALEEAKLETSPPLQPVVTRPTALSLSQRFSHSFWVYGALFALPVLLYLNTLGSNFVYDDLPLIVEHSKVQELSTPWRFFIGEHSGRPIYRAIRTLSYAIDYALGGMNPTVFHASNILYHALTVLVVFRLARILTGTFRAAFLAALLFAAHPIQTDAVAYLSGRRDILSTLFFLLGLLAFIRYRESGRLWRLGAAIGCYALAVMSKEMAITLPLLWLSYDLWRTFEPAPGESVGALFRRLGSTATRVFRECWLFYISCFGAAGAISLYLVFIARISRQKVFYGGSLPMALLTSARIITHYIKLLLFPATLSADYSFNAFPPTTSWTDASAWLAACVLLLLLVGLCRLVAFSKIAAFGGLWFFVTLLPVAQIIPHHELMAEHYLYLPSIGVMLLAGTLVDRWAQTPQVGRAVAIGFSTVLLLLSARTVVRNQDWKDELTLWQKTIQTAPASARAHTNLGLSYLDMGKHAPAEQEFTAALTIAPNDVHLLNSLGILYTHTGREAEAEQTFTKAVKVGMERNKKGLAAVALNNLGALQLGRHNDQEAEALFRQALEAAPGMIKPLIALGRLYLEAGRLNEAEQAFKQALAIRSDLRGPHLLLAHVYLYRGELDKAEREAEESLRRSRPKLPSGASYGLIGVVPEEKQATDTASAHAILAQVHLGANRPDRAEVEARAALENNPSLPAAHGILAQVYVARGLLEQAETEAKEAIRLQASNPGSAPYHFVLGIIYQRRGKTREAAQELQAALQLNPRFGAAREALQAMGATAPAP